MSVYTIVSPQEATALLSEYDVGEFVSLEGISDGIENTNYFLTTSQATFVLTVFEQHDAGELVFFLSLMGFLASKGVPTARPCKRIDGELLSQIQGKPAAIVQKLSGRGVAGLPTQAQCEAIGRLMAKMHCAGQSFEFNRKNDRDTDWMLRTAMMVEHEASAEERVSLRNVFSAIEALPDNLPKSVIHADLFKDNALFTGDDLDGVIDLYYACQGECIYDVAVLMNDWARRDEGLDVLLATALIRGYQSIRVLTPFEVEVLPVMLQKGALRFFLSRLKDKSFPRDGELTHIKNPSVFGNLLAWHQSNPAFIEDCL